MANMAFLPFGGSMWWFVMILGALNLPAPENNLFISGGHSLAGSHEICVTVIV